VYPHGDRLKYAIEACRCEACRAAEAAYKRRNRRRKAYGGDYWPWVNAERAREHIRWLMASSAGATNGVGVDRIAALTGVSRSTMQNLLYGERRHGYYSGPSRQIHRETEAKLLSVSRTDLADGATVDAGSTWELIECLKAYGIPYYRINAALGNSGEKLKLSKRAVRVSTAKAIERLHWGAWRASPEFQTRCLCDRPDYIQKLVEKAGDARG